MPSGVVTSTVEPCIATESTPSAVPSGTDRPELSAQVQAPVVAGHEVPLRELERARLEQLEAELAADRVRRRVVDVREGVHEAVLVVAPRAVDRLSGSRHSDAAALE